MMAYKEIAQILSRIAGRTIAYEEKTAEEVIANMIDANADKEAAALSVNTFQRLISKNQFTETSKDLKKLHGDNISSKKDAIASLLI